MRRTAVVGRIFGSMRGVAIAQVKVHLVIVVLILNAAIHIRVFAGVIVRSRGIMVVALLSKSGSWYGSRGWGWGWGSGRYRLWGNWSWGGSLGGLFVVITLCAISNRTCERWWFRWNMKIVQIIKKIVLKVLGLGHVDYQIGRVD